ncbi:acetyltransferase component of pyruvate dehydrogenase complex [Actinocatenispora thailandica]|uniref:Dihydrolipoamide acetyltransferase component of pyruvate dehydrogenase complex n=2 Tax=Actinocatenispora thailandica TaxID=227318 RepID=A0A7R7DL43_9ACTN|nr:dihydrolipoamide acetyltransferase family protein [Actinocatenispora thailandica]BCJ33530.1 acetyltransferase component of pyruvate dehydrogenase complex [Actinocatenispora thailandica]
MDILMPRLSDTMEEGVVASWRAKVGDEVHAGETLVEIETDKALMEHESYQDGVLTEILVPEGGSADIGAPIGRLRVAGEPEQPPAGSAGAVEGSAPAEAPARPTEAAAEETAAAAAPAPAGPSAPAADPVRANGSRVRATPLVRRLARESGVDLGAVTGSGPGGRIIRADLDRLAATPAPAAPAAAPAEPAAAVAVPVTEDDEVTPLGSMRRTIARRLADSMRTAPHFYLTRTVDAGPMGQLRAELNAKLVAAERPKISLNDIVLRAVAVTLRQHPEMNASFGEDAIVTHKRVHVGMAVATPAGLVVPVLRDADTRSLTDIAGAARELAGKARDRKLSPAEMSGSTFTVSNLGMFGVDQFTAVINPPEAGILAVGALREEPGVVDGAVAVVKRMTVTLSVDHRVVDGAQGAQFLADLARLLENPWLAIV